MFCSVQTTSQPSRPSFSLMLRSIAIAGLWGLCAFASLALVPQQVEAKKKRMTIERIVAVVNDEVILLSEWRTRFDAMKQALQRIIDPQERAKQAKVLQKRVLDQMIDDALIDQKARQMQVNVSDLEVQRGMEDTRRRYNLTAEQFQQALTQQGYTPTTYKMMVRKQLRKLKMLRQVASKKVRISEEDLKNAYRRATQGIKRGPSEYRIRHIVFKVDKKVKDKKKIDSIRREAKNVLTLALQQPNTFAALAKRFSQDPTSKEGGLLDFYELGSLDPAIEKAMITLKVGQVYAKLVRTVLGFHIIYLDGKRNANVRSYGDSKGALKRQLQQKAFQKVLTRYTKTLRKDAVIDIRL